MPMSQKTIKVWYWIVTGIFAAVMLFSGISELIGNEQGDKILLDLGYPLYLNLILGVAKIGGALILLQTKFKMIKEWAYAGFTFDILGASFSYALAGQGIGSALSPLMFLVVMFISYALWKKMKRPYVPVYVPLK